MKQLKPKKSKLEIKMKQLIPKKSKLHHYNIWEIKNTMKPKIFNWQWKKGAYRKSENVRRWEDPYLTPSMIEARKIDSSQRVSQSAPNSTHGLVIGLLSHAEI